jgi:serine/threonine protein kinase
VPPRSIRDYQIERPLGRGYYAATYLAIYGALQQQCVLKVIPKKLYEEYGKDFAAECKLHAQIATESAHVVPIRNMFDARIRFGGIVVDCHVAHLDFIEGETLDELLGRGDVPARTAAQIAIDLFIILDEFRAKIAHHNDLHGRNLIVNVLKTGKRADAIDESIRLVAVDLGSASDHSRSDPNTQKSADLHWTAKHLKLLADRVLSEPDRRDDLDYRLANVLEDMASRLSAKTTSQRLPSTRDLENQLRDAL